MSPEHSHTLLYPLPLHLSNEQCTCIDVALAFDEFSSWILIMPPSPPLSRPSHVREGSALGDGVTMRGREGVMGKGGKE